MTSFRPGVYKRKKLALHNTYGFEILRSIWGDVWFPCNMFIPNNHKKLNLTCLFYWTVIYFYRADLGAILPKGDMNVIVHTSKLRLASFEVRALRQKVDWSQSIEGLSRTPTLYFTKNRRILLCSIITITQIFVLGIYVEWNLFCSQFFAWVNFPKVWKVKNYKQRAYSIMNECW